MTCRAQCFEGIANLDFDDELVIHAMNSVEKERVPFKVRQAGDVNGPWWDVNGPGCG